MDRFTVAVKLPIAVASSAAALSRIIGRMRLISACVGIRVRRWLCRWQRTADVGDLGWDVRFVIEIVFLGLDLPWKGICRADYDWISLFFWRNLLGLLPCRSLKTALLLPE